MKRIITAAAVIVTACLPAAAASLDGLAHNTPTATSDSHWRASQGNVHPNSAIGAPEQSAGVQGDSLRTESAANASASIGWSHMVSLVMMVAGFGLGAAAFIRRRLR
jgi:hypothetical protein